MIDNSWVFDLETRIFGKVRVETEKKLKQEFPSIYYTTSDMNKGAPSFPTVYIHELPSAEYGNDLKGDAINAINYSMQVEVVVETNRMDAKKIMKEIILVFKQMHFNVQSFPSFENGNTYYRLVSRCQRIIGGNDFLF